MPEAAQHLAMSQARAEQVSGANEVTTQGLAGQTAHSNLGRSAAGANLIAAGAGSRPANFVEKLANQVIIPFLFRAHELNCAMLPLSTLKYILDDELQHEFLKDSKSDLVELMNARVKFSILAAAKMQARRNMAQALPIMIQFLTSNQTTQQLAIQGLKVNVAELMRMMFEVSDWKNVRDVITPMTPEDQQRWQAMQPAAQQQAKAATAKEMQDSAFQHKQEITDQENISRAGREVLRQAIEQSATPLAVSGEAGGRGFGANA